MSDALDDMTREAGAQSGPDAQSVVADYECDYEESSTTSSNGNSYTSIQVYALVDVGEANHKRVWIHHDAKPQTCPPGALCDGDAAHQVVRRHYQPSSYTADGLLRVYCGSIDDRTVNGVRTTTEHLQFTTFSVEVTP